MSPPAALVDEIAPSVTAAAHGETIKTNGKSSSIEHVEEVKVVEEAKPVAEDPRLTAVYPPYIDEHASYSVLPQYHSKPTKLRVGCVGAGASGLCLAYKMERQLVKDSWELTLFEKNEHFGGTWYENTYPGVACDVSDYSHCQSRV